MTVPSHAQKQRAKREGLSSEARTKRYENARKADEAELEIWKKVALELSELRKNPPEEV